MSEPYNKNDQKQWDQIFSNPNPAWRKAPEQPFMKDALAFFKSKSSKTLLDLGCGVGIWSVYFLKNGFNIFGTDFSENAVKTCRSWAKDENLDAQFEVSPINQDPFPHQTYDGIIASLIFENVSREEMRQSLALHREKLNSGGAIFAFFNPFLTESQKTEILKNTNNPTNGITSISYSDEEILESFKGFKLLSFKKYSIQGLDFRAIFVEKL